MVAYSWRVIRYIQIMFTSGHMRNSFRKIFSKHNLENSAKKCSTSRCTAPAQTRCQHQKFRVLLISTCLRIFTSKLHLSTTSLLCHHLGNHHLNNPRTIFSASYPPQQHHLCSTKTSTRTITTNACPPSTSPTTAPRIAKRRKVRIRLSQTCTMGLNHMDTINKKVMTDSRLIHNTILTQIAAIVASIWRQKS